MTDTRGWITVVQVCRDMGFEPEDRAMWRAGDFARDRWQMLGNEMKFDHRQKTHGVGSHLFAIYPPWFRPVIETIISGLDLERARQGRLF